MASKISPPIEGVHLLVVRFHDREAVENVHTACLLCAHAMWMRLSRPVEAPTKGLFFPLRPIKPRPIRRYMPSELFLEAPLYGWQAAMLVRTSRSPRHNCTPSFGTARLARPPAVVPGRWISNPHAHTKMEDRHFLNLERPTITYVHRLSLRRVKPIFP